MNIRYIHLYLFALLLLTAAGLSYLDSLALARILRSLIELIIIFVLPSFAFTQIIRQKVRLRIDFWESLTLASAIGLTVIPALNLILIKTLNSTPAYLAYLVSFSSLVLHALLIPKPSLFSFRIKTITWPQTAFWIVLAVFLSTTFAVMVAYPTLPDLDPYYWLRYTRQFNADPPAVSWPPRSLYFAFIYLFTDAAHVDSYAFFKVVFPLLSTLYLIPAWTLARLYRHPIQQTAILALPLITPSSLLYLQMPIPQALLILLAYYFLFLLIHAYITKTSWPYFTAGIVMGAAFLYHEIAGLIFATWLFFTIFFYRKSLLSHIKQNPIILILFLLLILSNLSNGNAIAALVSHWFKKLWPYFSGLNINWQFPAQYINIDENSMGWPGFAGIVKYYAYHAGPAVLTLLMLALIYTATSPALLKRLLQRKEPLVIASSFAVFFVISEILPRLFDLAVLPERSWIFAGIMASSALFLFLPERKKSFLISLIVVGLAIVSVGGAIFVNNQKKYIVPDYQLASAEWINDNLPNDRLIISSGNYNLLSYHASSLTFIATPQFFCASAEDSNQILSTLLTTYMPSRIQLRQSATTNFISDITAYFANAPIVNIEDVNSITEKNFKPLTTFRDTLDLNRLKKRIFVYYYNNDPRHPLLERPYFSQNKTPGCLHHNFTTRSDMEKIYDDNGRVEIWKFK